MPVKKVAEKKVVSSRKPRRHQEEEDEEDEEFTLESEEPEEEESEEEESEEEEDEPTPRKKKAAPARRELDFGEVMKPEDWQKILDQVSGGTGLFYFLKEGKTRLRLVTEPGTKTRWFIETASQFNGTSRTKAIVLAVLAAGKGVTEEMKGKVTPVVVSKSVVVGILNLLAEGYNLFSPTKGYGLTITRTGSGLDTSYNVLPSQEPRPLPDKLEWPKIKTLSGLADQYEEDSAARDGQRTSAKRRPRREEDESNDW